MANIRISGRALAERGMNAAQVKKVLPMIRGTTAKVFLASAGTGVNG